MVRLRAIAGYVAFFGGAGCTLFVPLDDLSEPTTSRDEAIEGGPRDVSVDAATTDAAAPTPVDPDDKCPCPNGLEKIGGVCVVPATSTVGLSCKAPIKAPTCTLVYEIELCATQTPFPYGAACGGKSRVTAFFSLGDLPGLAVDGGERRWVVKTTNIEVLGRTNAACTQGTEPCAEGPSPRGELTPSGATVAIGKSVTSSCTTARVEISTY